MYNDDQIAELEKDQYVPAWVIEQLKYTNALLRNVDERGYEQQTAESK